MLKQRADLPVRVLVVLTARVARVEAAPAAAEQRAQPLVQDVLALDVSFGQVTYRVEYEQEYDKQDEESHHAEANVGYDAYVDREGAYVPFGLGEPYAAYYAPYEFYAEQERAHVEIPINVTPRRYIGDGAQRGDAHNEELNANNGAHYAQIANEVNMQQSYIRAVKLFGVFHIVEQLRYEPGQAEDELD